MLFRSVCPANPPKAPAGKERAPPGGTILSGGPAAVSRPRPRPSSKPAVRNKGGVQLCGDRGAQCTTSGMTIGRCQRCRACCFGVKGHCTSHSNHNVSMEKQKCAHNRQRGDCSVCKRKAEVAAVVLMAFADAGQEVRRKVVPCPDCPRLFYDEEGMTRHFASAHACLGQGMAPLWGDDPAPWLPMVRWSVCSAKT